MRKKPVPTSPCRAMTWSVGELDLDDALRDHRHAVRVDAGEQRARPPAALRGDRGSASCRSPSWSADAAPPDSGAASVAERQGRSSRHRRSPIGLSRQTSAWHDARDDRPRRTARCDRGLRPLRRPVLPAARGGRPHLRRADVRRGRDGPAPGPLRLRVLRDRRRRGAVVRSTARSAHGSGRGDFFGEVSILLGEPPIADVVATRPLRCLVLPGPQVEPFLIAHPQGHVPDAPGAGAPPAGREPMAET